MAVFLGADDSPAEQILPAFAKASSFAEASARRVGAAGRRAQDDNGRTLCRVSEEVRRAF